MPSYDFHLQSTGVDELRAQLRALRADGSQAFGDLEQASVKSLTRLDSAQRDHAVATVRTGDSYAVLAERIAAVDVAAGRSLPAVSGTGRALVEVEAGAARGGAALTAYMATMGTLESTVTTVATSASEIIHDVGSLAETVVTTVGDLTETVAIGIAAVVGAFQIEGIIDSLARLKSEVVGDSAAFDDLAVSADEAGTSVAGMAVHWATYRAAAAGAEAVGAAGIASIIGVVGRLNLYVGVAAAAAAGLNAGARATDELTAAQTGLQKELERTHYAAGITTARIMELARAEEDSGTRSQKAIAGAAQALLSYQGISGPVFERSVRLMDDVAQRFSVSLPDAAKLLGTALQDPTHGLTGLTDAGVLFTRGTREAIRAAADLGDTARAQGIVLDTVAGQAGGAAAAVDESTRASARLDAAMTHLLETVGPFVVRLREIKNGILDLFTEPSAWVQNKTADAVEWLARAFDQGPLQEQITETGRKLTALRAQQEADEKKGGLGSATRAKRLQVEIDALQQQYARLLEQARALEQEEQKAAAGAARLAGERRSQGMADLGSALEQGFSALPATAAARIAAVNAEMDKLVEKADALRAADGSTDQEVDQQIVKIEQLREAKIREIEASERDASTTDKAADKRKAALSAIDNVVDRLQRERDALTQSEREKYVNNAALEAERAARGQLNEGELAEYIRLVQYEAGVTYDAAKAKQDKAAAEAEAARVADAAARDIARTSEAISKDVASNLWDQITGEAKAGDARRFVLNWFKRIAVEAAATRIIMPVTMQMVGTIPGLFGIQSPANQSAAGQGGAAGLTGQATDMATNWGMSKAMSWAGDKLGITGGFDAVMNTPVWGSAVSMSSTGAAAYTGTLVANPALAGPGLVQAGSLNAANGVVNAGNTAAANAAYSGTTTGASGTAGATLGGVLGTAGAGFAAGSLIGGWAGTSTNSKVVGGLSGAGAGAAAGAAMGTWVFPGVGTVIGALIGGGAGGLGGLIGTQKATVGPNSQGNVVISGGRFAEGPSAADNGGDATGVRQATAQIAAAFNAMADAYGLKAPDGTYGLFTGGDKVKGNGVRTPEELIRQLVGSLSADGLVGRALGSDVVKGTSDLEQINSYLSLAKRIEATTTALSELDKSLGGVQKAAFKAAADGLSPMLEEMKKAGEIGASAEYKALVSGQVTNLLDDIANPRQYTETQTAVATLTGQLAAWKSVLEQVNPELAKTIDAIEKKGLERIYQGVRTTYDASLNEAQGPGYRNNLQGVRDYWNANATDMVLAGRDPNALYEAQARQIIDGLTDSQIDDVASYFKDLDPVMASLANSLRGTTAAAKEAQKAVQANADSLTAWLNGQKLGDASSLSPWEKMLEAQRQFDAAISASRQNGDIAGATKAADALLSASRPALVLGTEAYSQREDWITSTLRNLGHELGLPGFKTGGSFEVGGWGGVDSTLVRFMATPGERVTVTRPDQYAQAAERTVVVKDNSDVVRALSQVVNVLSAKLDAVTAELASLKGEQRKGDNLKLAGAA